MILNEKLLQEAFKYSLAKTKRELVEIALKEFVENHTRLDVRDLIGTVELDPDYNHKKLRGTES